MRLAVGLAEHVPSAPPSPARVAETVQAVRREPEKRRRVPFHDEGEFWVELSKGSLRSNVGVEPLIRHERAVRPVAVPVVPVAADSRPRRVRIVLAVRRRRLDHVEQIREFASDPWPRVVLVRDRAHAELGHEAARDRRRGVSRGRWISASASVSAPPQSVIQTGRGSGRSTTRTIASAPGDNRPSPVAAMPYAGWPVVTNASSVDAPANHRRASRGLA